MKIYFAASIRGGNEDAPLYAELIEMLGGYGTVLTEHVGDGSYIGKGAHNMSREEIYMQDMDWLMSADVVVAEVTTPSLGVGYEIAIAEKLDKRLLCLFREGSGRNLSAMIGGNMNIRVENYSNTHDVSQIFENFFSK